MNILIISSVCMVQGVGMLLNIVASHSVHLLVRYAALSCCLQALISCSLKKDGKGKLQKFLQHKSAPSTTQGKQIQNKLLRLVQSLRCS
jgi:hypothetical protein